MAGIESVPIYERRLRAHRAIREKKTPSATTRRARRIGRHRGLDGCGGSRWTRRPRLADYSRNGGLRGTGDCAGAAGRNAISFVVAFGAGAGAYLAFGDKDEDVAQSPAATQAAPPSSTGTTAQTATTEPDLTTADLVEQIQPNVVLIESRSTTGSGFVVGRGQILTSAHVVEGSRQVTIEYADGAQATGTVTHLNSERDLALVEATGFDGKPLDLFGIGELKAGSECVVVGSPFGLEHSVSQGIVSNPDRDANGVRLVQFDAPVNPGNSGGPVVNDEGQVIGIVAAKVFWAEGMSFAVAYDEIRSFLRGTENGKWAYSGESASIPLSEPDLPAGDGDWQGSGWTVIVASIPDSEPDAWGRAEAKAAALRSSGFPAGVLWSTAYSSLNPGYCVAYSGSFTTRAQAAQHMEILRSSGWADAYPREVRP